MHCWTFQQKSFFSRMCRQLVILLSTARSADPVRELSYLPVHTCSANLWEFVADSPLMACTGSYWTHSITHGSSVELNRKWYHQHQSHQIRRVYILKSLVYCHTLPLAYVIDLRQLASSRLMHYSESSLLRTL